MTTFNVLLFVSFIMLLSSIQIVLNSASSSTCVEDNIVHRSRRKKTQKNITKYFEI